MKNLYSIKKVITLFALLFLAGCSQEKDFVIEQNHGKIDFEEKSFNELLTLPTFNAAYQKVAKKKGVFLTEDNARTALEDQHGFTITKDVPVKIFKAEEGTIFYTILIEREIEEELKFENLIIKVENEVTTAGIFKYTMADLAIKLESHDAYKFDIIKTEYTDLNIEGRTIAAINSDGAICITSETVMCNAYEAGYDPIHNVHGSCLAYAATHNFSNILIDSQTQCYGYEGGGGSTSNGGTIIPTTTNPSHGPIININSNSVITSPTLCVNCVNYTPTFHINNLGLTASEMNWLNNNLSIRLQIQWFLNSNNTQEDYNLVKQFITQSIQNPSLSLNFNLSVKSPYFVDMLSVSGNTPEEVKFREVYNALTQSSTFRKLFTNLFGPTPTFNVKFLIENLPQPQTGTLDGLCSVYTSTINTYNVIRIDRNHLLNKSKVNIAITILHECIHAYLNVKLKHPNTGLSIESLNDMDFQTCINTYYNGFSGAETQHNFFVNFMIPTMTTILTDIKDLIVSPEQAQGVENPTNGGALIYEPLTNPPTTSISDIIVQWNWNTFFTYICYFGLHNCSDYPFNYPAIVTINDYYLFYYYSAFNTIFNP